MSQPIGIEVTDNILARIDGFDRLMMKGLLDLDDPADEDEQILADAVIEAIVQYQAGQARGFLLCNRFGPLQAWSVPQADLLLTGTDEEAPAEFWGHDGDSQAHVDRFRALLQRVQGEA